MFAVCGVLINLHYCGQQLASWNIYGATDGCGGACGDESKEDHDCCSDETVNIKISQDHSLSTGKFKNAADESLWFADALTPFSDVPNCFCSHCSVITHLPQPPPGPWQNIPLYKLFSSLTYYG